ncbi:MAG: chorismate mutase [Coriobacteriia bacterium]|nr:chorismate mutase [Coriobacteriia bacterium]
MPKSSSHNDKVEVLAQLRQRIDGIDDQIRELFLARMELVKQIADIKQGSNIAVQQLDREQEILARLTADLSPEQVVQMDALYREILKASRDSQ